MNLEPVVGALIGWIAFGNAAGAAQLGGAVAVLAGIALSTAGAGPAQSRSHAIPRRPIGRTVRRALSPSSVANPT